MKVVIDRFEEQDALVELESREIVRMPKSLVPKGGKEGDVLDITIDEQETRFRKEKAKERMKNLWERSQN